MPSLSGQQFGRLTALMPSDKGKHFIMARCECGGLWEGYKYSLLRGLTKSCGCEWRQPKHGHATRAAGKTREYRIWQAMIDRCTNPRNGNYSLYGGRGIVICPQWRSSFEAFIAEIGPCPSNRHSVDRIDNSRGYEPGNVRWATPAEQSRNTRRCRWITINGVTKLFSDWCRDIGLYPSQAYRRIAGYGWTVEEALTTPSRSAA